MTRRLLLLALTLCASPAVNAATIRGRVVNAENKRILPCRLYVRGDDGTWHHARSRGGSAVDYRKKRYEHSYEFHTTLSAHEFELELAPGGYELTVERGKEYRPATRRVTLGEDGAEIVIELQRWIDMAALGWYSGDTHVHRSIEELPNLLLAEDLNVALPLTQWVTRAFEAPAPPKVDASGKPRYVDRTHVFHPRSTEYEIFTVGGKRHMLGAVFVLGHESILDLPAPPVAPIAERARREGALLELDKHNWPWSMAIIPVMDVDLFELTNNHVWRTEFGFTDWAEREAAYMKVERDEKGWTERGWIDFGLENYYALLSCGFRMRPTAGTASGVHPVPLGFGRVYVHIDGEFSYEKWMRGLDDGRSFVTTGPMLFATVDGRRVGHAFVSEVGGQYAVRVRALSAEPIDRVELVVNGEVRPIDNVKRARTESGAHEVTAAVELELRESAWIAVRCFEKRANGRVRFAHGAPFHFDIGDKPVRPRREEVEYLMRRVESQIERSRGTIPATAIAEYERALAAYREVAKRAR